MRIKPDSWQNIGKHGSHSTSATVRLILVIFELLSRTVAFIITNASHVSTFRAIVGATKCGFHFNSVKVRMPSSIKLKKVHI